MAREAAKSRGDRLIPLEECRRILGPRCAGWSDAELERHVEQLEGLAQWCFEEVERRRAAGSTPLADLRKTA